MALNGKAIDFFALGICLFFMCEGELPFYNKKSPINDFRYRLLMEGKFDQFWKQHASSQLARTHSKRRKQDGPPSEHYKNLFQTLVHPDARARFQYPEALYMWTQVGMASDEEVKKELRKRCAAQTQAQTGKRGRGRPRKV